MEDRINLNIDEENINIHIDETPVFTVEINPIEDVVIELNEQGPAGPRGYRGETGNGIASFELTSLSGLTDIYTITFTDGNTQTIDVENGRGISSIILSNTEGLIDTYTITYNDNTTSTFNVTNGKSAVISGANATINNTVGTPSVNVITSGTPYDRSFTFEFENIKGEQGERGPQGEQGPVGPQGPEGGTRSGVKGDYCTTYGIEYCQYGLITNPAGTKNITVKGGMMLCVPGAETKTTIGSDINYTVTSNSDVTIFYVDGNLLEASKVYFTITEPTETVNGYIAWWNPDHGKWQFKSNDTGNVWRDSNATPLADIRIYNGVINRIDYIGYRVLNDDIYAIKSEVDSSISTINNTLNTKANDINVVHKTGNESISGIKTFNDNIKGKNSWIGTKLTPYIYSTSLNPASQFYWYKIFSPKNRDTFATYEITAHSDSNYAYFAKYTVAISSYSRNKSCNVNVYNHGLLGTTNLKVAMDADGNVYMSTNCIWGTYFSINNYAGTDLFEYENMGYAPWGDTAGFESIGMITDSGAMRYLFGDKVTYSEPLVYTPARKAIQDGEGRNIVSTYQEKLTAGDNINIEDNVISSTSSGLQMFDIILKDHMLTYEESKGLALQGTYVYKNAIAGSRYGYADFYNKVVEEYENSTFQEYDWIQPILTENGTLGGDSFAVSPSGTYSTYYAWEPFGANANATSAESWVASGKSAEYTMYFPEGVKISNIKVYNRNESGSPRAITGGTVYASDDNSTWVALTTFTNTNTTYLASWDIALNPDNYYKYYKLAVTNNDSYIGFGKLDITAKYTHHTYKNPNGHVFYDIAKKDVIDSIFESTGSAWFYGIDIVNERIFLPRDKYFAIQGKVDIAGNGMTIGLTNGSLLGGFNASGNALYVNTGSYGTSVGTAGSGTHLSANAGFGLTTDPTKSGIEGKLTSNTDKYLYICVGNTESRSSITDVVDVTTTENDTVPLFTGLYFDFTPNNASWLKGGQQANNAGIYKTCYNELVNVLNGSTKYGDLKVVDTAKMTAGVDYSEYWKVNQTNMTFTTPTKISYLPINGDTAPVIGNGMSLGLTNGTNTYSLAWNGGSPKVYASITENAGSPVGTTSGTAVNGAGLTFGVTTDATKSGLIADLAGAKSQTAQLYFKVANAVQNLELLDVGEVMEAVADKISRQDCKAYIVETYVNGTSWYNVWSNGWCEQGGYLITPATGDYTINFLKSFNNTNYTFTSTYAVDATGGYYGYEKQDNRTVNSIVVRNYANKGLNWRVCGYIA